MTINQAVSTLIFLAVSCVLLSQSSDILIFVLFNSRVSIWLYFVVFFSLTSTSYDIYPWRRKWQPTPVFLPGEPHGQRSLVGYSPWGRKELDMTERLRL